MKKWHQSSNKGPETVKKRCCVALGRPWRCVAHVGFELCKAQEALKCVWRSAVLKLSLGVVGWRPNRRAEQCGNGMITARSQCNKGVIKV